MTRWEYKLIHLNLAPPAGAPAQSPPAAPPSRSVTPPASPAPAQPTAPFSKAYLEQEFPGFYASQLPAEQTGRPSNPVLQLQGFLNTQGDDGWCLLGFYNVGPMLLMAFRRRRPGASEQVDQASSEQPEPSPGLLEEILDRLNRLEQGHRSDAALAESSEHVQIISAQQLRRLPVDHRVTTAEAARQLGFRSSATLSAFLRRHRYEPGLVKRGQADRVAVYEGASSGPGKRRQHVWLLVDGCLLDQA